eukprot:SAG11_NODE_4129_length_2050_cov_1.347002_1_plen_165_part_00
MDQQIYCRGRLAEPCISNVTVGLHYCTASGEYEFCCCFSYNRVYACLPYVGLNMLCCRSAMNNKSHPCRTKAVHFTTDADTNRFASPFPRAATDDLRPSRYLHVHLVNATEEDGSVDIADIVIAGTINLDGAAAAWPASHVQMLPSGLLPFRGDSFVVDLSSPA